LTLKFHSYHLKRLSRSKLALALPVTFLILFVSTLGIVAFTYCFSVEKISAQSQTLKVSTAKQSLLDLDDTILSTLWQPGSSSTYELKDSGGITNIQPNSNVLTLSINDTLTVQKTIFNSTIGQAVYELPYSGSSQTGLYLKGDSSTITSKSGASISQLCIQNGAEHPEIQLQYRPIVTYATAGLEDGRTVNNIRIYIVNLNSSQSMTLQGNLPLRITCTNAQLSSQTYTVSSATENLVITSVLNGDIDTVSIPISTTSEGALINVETVECNITIARWIR
jgi:hypothetical protein